MEEAPGFDAIEAEMLRVYPGQTNPNHYAPDDQMDLRRTGSAGWNQCL